MKRLTQEFEIYSHRDQGTAILMVLWADKIPPPHPHWKVGAICLPLEGEDVCGDAWVAEADENFLTLLVADGLGHGPDAAKASNAALAIIPENLSRPPAVLINLAHTALHGTRGAAVAISQIDLARGELKFAGVGNIAASIFVNAGRKHLISHNGIVGSNLRKVQEFTQSWESGALLIAHSDGLGTRWDLEQYPGLATAHPSLIAAILYRDFGRRRDDVTLVVIRGISGF